MAAGKTHLVFDVGIGKDKPITVVSSGVECPFCRREQLEGIIAQDGEILLLHNKYPVLRDTVQTVLIETADCNSELSLYPKDYLYRVIRFAVKHWQAMMESGEFASVILYKNHGPYSGGTIKHPHMQIVGLKNIDYRRNITPECLNGEVIWADGGVELNLARQPKIGFMEFNIRAQGEGSVEKMADCIQRMAHYLLHHFHWGCDSYNLFFYQFSQEISVKIMPRFVTSPLFVGYSIPQVSSRAGEVVKEIRSIYFE
ncbi:MAG TPA: DUF4931 domain-containing protein [Selenomonadales bacterium]|nr:DUF4931 domain-containing protein [Selenomonadales bacterium]